MSTVDPRKKIGRPRVDSEEVSVRMHRDQLDQLDAWRAAQPDEPSRPEAVRRLLRVALDE